MIGLHLVQTHCNSSIYQKGTWCEEVRSIVDAEAFSLHGNERNTDNKNPPSSRQWLWTGQKWLLYRWASHEDTELWKYFCLRKAIFPRTRWFFELEPTEYWAFLSVLPYFYQHYHISISIIKAWYSGRHYLPARWTEIPGISLLCFSWLLIKIYFRPPHSPSSHSCYQESWI